MKQHTYRSIIAPVALIVLLLVVAACAPVTQQPAPGAEAPAEGEAQAPASGEVITLFVGPETVECTGVGPQQCLQVKYAEEEAWQLFYDQIAGFEFEPGYVYELSVQRDEVENPPADASKYRYALVEVVSQTAVEPTAQAGAEAAPSALEGTEWQLEAYADANGDLVDVIPDIPVTIVLDGGRVGGNGGCNTYFGTYELDGSSLTIAIGGTTMMACPDEIMAQEQAYLAVVSTAASYAITGDKLQIMDANGTVVASYAARGVDKLADIVWSALAYNNGRDAVVSVLADTTITAVFAADGTLSGSSGCNTYMTTYTVDGSDMIISAAIASTKMMCEQAIMDQEMAYLAALPTTATFGFRNGNLELRTTDGALVAQYGQAEMGSEPVAESEAPVATEEVTATAAFEGVIWEMVSYLNDAGEVVDAVTDAPATALFAEGAVTGTTGCNRYAGSYDVDGNNLTIVLGPMTMMACPEPLMAQEQGYVAALGTAATYQITGEQLEIVNGNGDIAVTFVIQPQTPLVGTNWTVTNYNNGREAVVGVLEGSQMTALFGEDGVLSGSGGCNNYRTGYSVDGGSITIDPEIAMTRMACDPAVMDQESLYLAALATVATYTIDGDVLEMRTADGAMAVRMQAGAEAAPEGEPAPETTPAAEATPAPAPEAAPSTDGSAPAATALSGIVWKWQGTQMGDDSKVEVKFPNRYTVEFMEDGTVHLRADCNSGGGAYKLDGANLTMEVAAKTKKACHPDSKGNLFIQQLNASATHVMDDGNLVINLFADSGNMVFANGGPSE